MIDIKKVKELASENKGYKVTGEELAYLLDVTKITISKWSVGKTEPKLSQVLTMVELCGGVELDKILT